MNGPQVLHRRAPLFEQYTRDQPGRLALFETLEAFVFTYFARGSHYFLVRLSRLPLILRQSLPACYCLESCIWEVASVVTEIERSGLSCIQTGPGVCSRFWVRCLENPKTFVFCFCFVRDAQSARDAHATWRFTHCQLVAPSTTITERSSYCAAPTVRNHGLHMWQCSSTYFLERLKKAGNSWRI